MSEPAATPAGPPFTILSTCQGGGYRYCRTDPPHPRRNAKGLYPLHRVLMENHLGRLLEPGEDVHHRDEDKTNDVIENLQVMTKSEHARHHRPRVAPVTLACPCGREFTIKPHFYRRRLKVVKGPICCSRACGQRFVQARKKAACAAA